MTCSKSNIQPLKELMGNGKEFGIYLSYIVSESNTGPLGGLKCSKVVDFVKNKTVCLILDGVLHGGNLNKCLTLSSKLVDGCIVLGGYVDDPRSFGLIKMKGGKVAKIIEKPKMHPSKSKKYLVQTHIYFFDSDLIRRIKTLKPSNDGEYRMGSLTESYLYDNIFKLIIVKDTKNSKFIWDDFGTSLKRYELTKLVAKKQKGGNLIGSPHYEAFKKGWIDVETLKSDIAIEKRTPS